MAFKLTAESQARYDEWSAWAIDQRLRFANLTDENLVASAKLYMANMSPIAWAPGEPVYDGTFFHAIVPEILRRLSDKAESAE